MQHYDYKQVFENSINYFNGDELAAKVFTDKYALQNDKGEFLELSPREMHERLAKEFARIEANYVNPMTEKEIFELLDKFKYIVPQGSPMSAIGNPHHIQSLSNCFVVENPYDSYGGILKTDQELAQISKRRGGVGVNISTIRPRGLATANAAKTTDGISIFMERFSNTIREVGQCLAGNTLVLTINGLKRIDEIKIGDEVWTANKWVPVENILKNKKKIVKLTTRFGKEIYASEDHIFHTIYGEKKIKDLSVGDPITQIVGVGWQGNDIHLKPSAYVKTSAISREHNNLTFPTTITVELAYLLGLMYGDGCVEKKHISVALSDDWIQITDKFEFIVNKIFNLVPSVKNKSGEKCSRGRIHSKEIMQFLQDNSLLKEKAGKLIFPKVLFFTKPEVVFSFLSGYFDSDGCVQVSKKQYKISSICKDFLNNVQNVLSAHGIVSKLHKEIRADKDGQENWKDLYKLTINGNKSQDLFRSLMKESIKINTLFFDKKRRDYIRSCYTVKDFNSNSNKHSYIIDNNQFITYSTLDRIKEDLKQGKNTFLLQDYVEEISKQSALEEEVYDLILPREHLFFANGLYAHNSGRRGALMITCSVHHPEVLTFINIKKDLKKVTGANISLQLSDEFITAVKKNEKYQLRWPVDSNNPTVSEWIDAKAVWDEIISAAHQSAEPGILFWDTSLRRTPSDIYADCGYRSISTNPCSELILSKYDSCRLLLLNLVSYVKHPFKSNAEFNFNLFSEHCQKAQRLMDDMIDLELECIDRILHKIKKDPESKEIKAIELDLWKNIKIACENGRRTGTGITGIGDCIAMLNLKYGSEDSIKLTENIYKTLAINCYKASCIMAGERGTFPVFSHEKEKGHEFLEQLWQEDIELYKLYKKYGRRNIALLTTAPAGSVSTQTQTTSGIEPAYLLEYKRRKKINPSDKNVRVDFVDHLGDKWQEFVVYHHGLKQWMEITGETDIKKSPYWGATSNDIDWLASVRLQGVAQRWTCHAISKTCNLPSTATKELVSEIYMASYDAGCKGFTVYRDGCRTGVLISNDKSVDEERPLKIKKSFAPKRLEELLCDIKKVKIQGAQWTMFIGLFDGKPYEIFGGLSKYVDIPNKYKIGKIVKNGKIEGITTYNLIIGEDDDQMLIKDLANVFDNANYGAFTRTISLSLRHGVPVQFIVEQLQKDKYSDITSFSRVLARVLKQYIIDGTIANGEKICPSCKKENTLVYQEGCLRCVNAECGFSRCG